MVLTLVVCSSLQAQTINVFKQSGKNGGNITVKYNTGGITKAYYLGVSYRIGNGPVIDLKGGFFRVRGKSSKKFSASTLFGIIGKAAKANRITWIAKLWKRKVPKRKCKNAGGHPCRWCLINGYHLEGCVASAEAVGNLD